MATTTVNSTIEGIVSRLDSSASTINWVTTTRNAATGTNATTFASGINKTGLSPRASYQLAKGVYSTENSRTFLFFDVSGVGGTITAATLKVYASSPGNSVDTQVVEATAWGGDGSTTTLGTGDYDAVSFTTTYSPALLSWTATAYNDYTLNATAISAMNTDGYLNCAILTEDYDLKGVAPALGEDWYIPINFENSSNPIYLDITFTPAGWNDNIMGVANASIGNFIGVAEASIGSVNGT